MLTKFSLTKIISMIKKTLKWPLVSGRALRRWVSDSGKLLILGDAAHAMVPYMSQGAYTIPPRLFFSLQHLPVLAGAAMAVEDAAALSTLLSLITTPSQLPAALRVFERIRITRTAQMQQASLINGTIWHYADGPEQRARDEAMRPEVEGRHFIESPNQWSDPVTQAWCYGYDAEKAAGEAWRECMEERSMTRL